MQQIKLCKDCKHEDGPCSKYCTSPNNGVSPVNGEITVRSSFHNRRDWCAVYGGSTCGKNAKWFEAKDKQTNKPWYMAFIPWVKS